MTEFSWALLALIAASAYAICCFIAAVWAMKDFWRK